jgi:hypothetical protein
VFRGFDKVVTFNVLEDTEKWRALHNAMTYSDRYVLVTGSSRQGLYH